jgi:hypothetical protein
VAASFVGRAERGEPPSMLELQRGAGARDPRTKATIPRFRDALAGRLDTLLEAYRELGEGWIGRVPGSEEPARGSDGNEKTNNTFAESGEPW